MDTSLEVNVKYRKDDSELLSDKATKPLHLRLEHNKIDHSLFTKFIDADWAGCLHTIIL